MLIGPYATEDVRASIAIVGAGPAGLALALGLAERKIDVALIESGFDRPDDFVAALGLAAAPAGALNLEGLRRFGGLTWAWGGRCVALDAVDFEPRPGAEAPGWPLARAELMSGADAAAAFLGIGAADFDAPPLAGSRITARLERWAAQPRLARMHRRAVGESPFLRAYLGLTCVGADIDEGGRVRALLAAPKSASRVRVEADTFVLAAGGVETARLLLWLYEEAGRTPPAWLGRGLMAHLFGRIADITFTEDPGLDYRRDGPCFTRRRLSFTAETLLNANLRNIAFHIDNPPFGDWRHGSAGLSLMALALSACGDMLAPRAIRDVLVGPRGGALQHMANVARDPLSAARFAARAIGGRMSRPVRPGVIEPRPTHGYSLRFSAEDVARFESAVGLSRERDALGIPRACVARRFAPEDVASVLQAHELLDDELRAAGAGQLDFHLPPERRAASIVAQSADLCHQIGTARMGDDPHSSVTDVNARVHDLANLYVAGSAVFPTSGQANPTFSIVCQALRLADHLARARNASIIAA